MASVKVAVRVRPFNQREKDMNAKLIVQMEGKKTRLLNSKEHNDGSREKSKDFTFDYSYWSFDGADPQYASQDQVFADLGVDVIDSAFEGYNACVFAYGQTGSGKTFTMMGSPDNQGLIPRICRQLFSRIASGKESGASYRTEVSYLEIYNERVADLLAGGAGGAGAHALRVREHPKLGPYVQDLSRHRVDDLDQIQECMHRGNLQRTTASTQMNDTSSRSHAIFTLTFVQASYLRHNNMPSETVAKVHLVDLAGSERADATGATGARLVEGAHINKSLVTLGSVISALADCSQQTPPDGRTPKGSKKVFIPYRDSVLTWLLKDSLGGNSKTIMIAAISPADCNYGETLSTLRYANRAKNIINKPTINEDPNVKLIRELREEIEKLRKQITLTTDPIDTESSVLATLQRKEAQEKVLTEKWTEKWRETQQILQEQKALGLRKSGLGVVLDSDMPHLVGIDDNLLSTGVTLYHLKEGETLIGSDPSSDILVSGADVLPSHCRITLRGGAATLLPRGVCWLNTVLLDQPTRLSQGCILLLGRTNMFRYNDPAEAAKLRQEGAVLNLSRLSLLSWSTTDLTQPPDPDSDTQLSAQRQQLELERQQFLQQQKTRQESWQAERKQLLQAQKKLHEERSAMEREYSLACRRLSGDWSTLERGWSARRRALRVRARQLRDRQRRHQATSERHARAAETEGEHAAALRRLIEGKAADLDGYVRSTVKELVAQGYTVDESLTPSPESPISDVSSESLMRILEQCDPDTATSIKDTVERHKQEISELESELDIRTASVASHRAKVERLQAELALLAAQEEGLRRALASDDAASPEPSPLDGVKRSKSELVLRPSRDDDDVLDPLSADEREEFRSRKNSLTLPLDPLGSPESYHTASPTSATPTADTTTPTADAAPSLVSSWPTTDAASSLVSSSRQTADSEHSLVSSSRQTADSEQSLASSRPEFLIDGRCDEDGSSNDECSTFQSRVADGQSSSSLDRSPDERHQRAKYRRRLGDGKPRRQVTEAEALRAMQRLCQRIAAQKMLVISSLENDCSKEDLNRQIAVLQELQKKYVRLEMALQYSFFEPRAQEPPPRAPRPAPLPLAPIVSEVQVPDSTLQVTDVNENSFEDPLMSRLKECELEASDNVSTSNDELHSDRDWSDREERRLRRAHTDTLPPTITDGLTHPIDFDQVIVIPGWVTRGAGASTHHEYEVRVTLGRERYTLLRRYRRFRQLQLHANKIYGQKVASIPFPPRTLWPGAGVARARRPALEAFVRRLLAVCATDPQCPFHRAPLNGDTLRAFSPFFRKGVFESGKCGTG